MGNIKLTRLFFFPKGILENISKRVVMHREVQSRNLHGSNWIASLKEKLKTNLPTQSGSVSIYKVPTDLHQVEPKAYEPNIVSIGPYHHGLARLKAMEYLKWSYFHRLFHQNQNCDAKLDNLIHELKKLEQEARECYEEDLKFTKDEFTKIMLLDGCFVVELFRELTKNNDSVFIKRWMLPILRRDLIMLENQLPLFVLCKVFELTSIGSKTQNPSLLKELALQFFDPLLPRDSDTIKQSSSTGPGDNKAHFLDLFRSSILPRIASRGKEPHMFRSIAELKESGIKIKKAEENCRPLKLSFNKGVLKIPPLYFDDYKFTLFRNMVAFEQCHSVCKADVTMYLFFLDGLINSAKDIELLHYAGVIQHSLGGNKQVARLVNKLCREVAGDVDESYLHKMVWKINCYCNDGLTTKIAKLKHEYFYNPWASISTLAAILLLYLSLLQTSFALADAEAYLEKTGFWVSLKDSFLIPCPRLFWSRKSTMIPIIPEAGFKDYEYILGIQSSYYELFRYAVYNLL